MAHVQITNLLSDNPIRRSSKTINAFVLEFSHAQLESLKQFFSSATIKQPEMAAEILVHLEGNVIASLVKNNI
jgi:hypothetical protein